MAAKRKTAKKASNTSAAKNIRVPKPKNGEQYSQSELYEIIKECCELDSRKVAKDVYANFANMIQNALKKGYKIPLPGLGKIQVREFKARMGRNPATGESIRIPARKRVRMTPSKSLKQQVL